MYKHLSCKDLKALKNGLNFSLQPVKWVNSIFIPFCQQYISTSNYCVSWRCFIHSQGSTYPLLSLTLQTDLSFPPATDTFWLSLRQTQFQRGRTCSSGCDPLRSQQPLPPTCASVPEKDAVVHQSLKIYLTFVSHEYMISKHRDVKLILPCNLFVLQRFW